MKEVAFECPMRPKCSFLKMVRHVQFLPPETVDFLRLWYSKKYSKIDMAINFRNKQNCQPPWMLQHTVSGCFRHIDDLPCNLPWASARRLSSAVNRAPFTWARVHTWVSAHNLALQTSESIKDNNNYRPWISSVLQLFARSVSWRVYLT